MEREMRRADPELEAVLAASLAEAYIKDNHGQLQLDDTSSDISSDDISSDTSSTQKCVTPSVVGEGKVEASRSAASRPAASRSATCKKSSVSRLSVERMPNVVFDRFRFPKRVQPSVSRPTDNLMFYSNTAINQQRQSRNIPRGRESAPQRERRERFEERERYARERAAVDAGEGGETKMTYRQAEKQQQSKSREGVDCGEEVFLGGAKFRKSRRKKSRRRKSRRNKSRRNKSKRIKSRHRR